MVGDRMCMTGMERTYLANEVNFAVVKTLQSKNLIVPIVGDFAGPKALRAVGAFLKARGATVTAFYVSNVEIVSAAQRRLAGLLRQRLDACRSTRPACSSGPPADDELVQPDGVGNAAVRPADVLHFRYARNRAEASVTEQAVDGLRPRP